MANRRTSLRSLDALNFFNVGIQTGLGPFIANAGQRGISAASAFVGNAAFGCVAKSMGFNVSFIGHGTAAVCGGALFFFRMPETDEGNGMNA